MNENDLSDLVSKTKKSGGSKTKRTRAKSAKATASKKILVYTKKPPVANILPHREKNRRSHKRNTR